MDNGRLRDLRQENGDAVAPPGSAAASDERRFPGTTGQDCAGEDPRGAAIENGVFIGPLQRLF